MPVRLFTVFIVLNIIERIGGFRQDLVYFALVIEPLRGEHLFGISFELRVELKLLLRFGERELRQLP